MPDEGVKQKGKYKPYKQSERNNIYKKYLDKLLKSGKAYYAFDTTQELNKKREEYEAKNKTFSYDVYSRMSMDSSLNIGMDKTFEKIDAGIPYVVRFRMPENIEVHAKDIIRGDIKFNTSTLDDKVIFKSDGLPTYHLANVIDDHLMKITHVIRGEEWLPSLPLHIMLYKAFGWENEMPEFAHLPLILKPSGKGKLSKRDGDKDGFPVFPLEWKSPEGEVASGYRESGYFPEAVINILALLGWNSGTEQEIYSLDEMVDAFSLERVNKSGARFDPDKAKWFNQHYLQTKTDRELAASYNEILKKKGIVIDIKVAEKIVGMVKERAVFVNDLWDQSSYLFVMPENYDEQAVKKFWKEDSTQIVADCLEILKKIENFKSSEIEVQIKNYVEKHQLGFGKIMNPLRIAVVGAAIGPHLFDIFEMIGRDETIKRLEKAMKEI